MKLLNCCDTVGFILMISSLLNVQCGAVSNSFRTTYVVSGNSAAFQCPPPQSSEILDWFFNPNNSDVTEIGVAHFFQGIVAVFGQFDLPPGRTTLINGRVNISDVGVADEGEYWCERRAPGLPAIQSQRYPLHVYVEPKTPVLIPQGKDLTRVLEYTTTTLARCVSSGGKPATKLSWWNGTVQMPNVYAPVVSKNPSEDSLWDTSLDLVVQNWTRFDHRRNFTCLVEHPAYGGLSKRLNHSINVLYHPVGARIWADLVNLTVHCEADGYPAPIYSWILPGGDAEVKNASSLQMPNLFQLPSKDYFQCTADNQIPHPATVRVLVEDLQYPDGRPVPTFLNLSIYIWIAIGSGVLLLIIVAVIIACCCCKKKDKSASSGDRSYTRPIVKHSANRQSQPSLLEFDSMRTPDGRESSAPPSDYRSKKGAMERSYSLEDLADRKFGGDPRSSVTLLPLKGHQVRDPLYNDTSLNRRASREEIDKIADHIEVLNKSWDDLARSRENLVRSREELHVDLPPQYESHNDLSDPRGNERDTYPYMDDTVDSRKAPDPSRSYSNRPYYEHEIIHRPQYRDTDRYPASDRGYHDDRRSGYYGNNYGDDENYGNDQRESGRYPSNQPYRDAYQDNQPPDDGYRGDQRGGGYSAPSDRYGRPEPSGYQQQEYDYNNRQPSYGDSEFDDDQGYGYQPASMI